MDNMLKEMNDGDTVTFRQWEITKVPGGWIFKHNVNGQLVFIPIPGM